MPGKQHPLRDVYRGMMRRCYDPKAHGYWNYGARGITVCERWHKAANFYADMGPCPSKKHQLGRKDNNLPYCPENCEWQTHSQQQRNRRTNRLLILNGETMCVAAWTERTGLPIKLIFSRLQKGWSDEKTLATPRLTVGGWHVA